MMDDLIAAVVNAAKRRGEFEIQRGEMEVPGEKQSWDAEEAQLDRKLSAAVSALRSAITDMGR